MTKMKAMRLYGPNDWRLEEVEVPELEPHELLVKVKAIGVCPSDIKAIRQGRKWALEKLGGPGHEFAGEVVKVGSAVTSFKSGDRVTADLEIRCGNCKYCLSGRDNLCVNAHFKYCAYAEYVITPERQTFKIPERVSYEEAALTEPLSCVYNGNRLANIHPGDWVVILGAGPIGLMHLQLAKNLSNAYVIVSEPNDKRAKVAHDLGADIVVNPFEENLLEIVKDATNGMLADSVIVSVGIPDVMSQALELVGKTGTVMYMAGVYYKADPNIPLNLNKIHYNEINVTGSYSKTLLQFKKTLSLMDLKVVDLRRIISHRFSLEKAFDAIEIAEKQQGLKVIVIP